MGATVAVYDFPCLRRNENGVESVSLLAVELYPAVVDAVGGKGKQVAYIDAKETEREQETVNVAHLPVLHGHLSQRPQDIGGKVTLGGFNSLDAEFAERVERGHFLIQCEVEDRTDIAQVDVACVDGWGSPAEKLEEGAQPVGGDGLEHQAVSGWLKLCDAFPSCFIDFTSALVCDAFNVLFISGGKGHMLIGFGTFSGEHCVPELLCRDVGTIVGSHDYGLQELVIMTETVEKVVIEKITVGTEADTGAHGIPLVGHYGLGEGNVGSATTVVNGNAQGAGAVILGRACVEVYFEGSHIFDVRLFCGYFSATKCMIQQRAAVYIQFEIRKNQPTNK